MAKKILLVEDQAIPRMVVKSILTNQGYEVVEAASATESVERAVENIDGILMDIGLPEGTEAGIDATRKIRAKGGVFAKMPIIALSANEDSSIKLKMTEGGATDYLTKPVNPEFLIEILNEYLNAE